MPTPIKWLSQFYAQHAHSQENYQMQYAKTFQLGFIDNEIFHFVRKRKTLVMFSNRIKHKHAIL